MDMHRSVLSYFLGVLGEKGKKIQNIKREIKKVGIEKIKTE
jgi:hypothetical protein